MKKKFQKVLCILLCLLITLSSTSVMSIAAVEEQQLVSMQEESFIGSFFQSIINFFKNIIALFKDIFVFGPKYEYALSSNTKELLTSSYSSKVIFYLTTNNYSIDDSYLLDDNGDILAEFCDDGNYSSSGDDIAGDGVYSCIVYLSCNEETTEYFFATVDGDKLDTSTSIKIIAPLTTTELNNINTVDSQLKNLLSSFGNNLSDEQKTDAVMEKIDALVAQDLIIADSVYLDEETGAVSFDYSCGVPGGIVYISSDDKIAGNSAATIDATDIVTQSIDSDTAYVGEAAITYGWDHNYSSSDYYPLYLQMMVDWENRGLNTTVNTATTVEEYKTEFLNKDLVVIAEHGTEYKYWSGIFSTDTKYLIVTQQSTSKSMSQQLSADIKEERVYALTFVDESTQDTYTAYCLSPEFFSYYYEDKLNDSIVYLSSCMSFGNGDIFNYSFGEAFVDDCGASVAMGYHNSVYILYTIVILDVLADNLLNGETVSTGLDEAFDTYGDDDIDFANAYTTWNTTGHSAAYLLTEGDENARLISTTLENGNFEQANYPVKWKYKGDVRIINRLGELTPTKDNRMLILTTGIGSKEDDYLSGTEGSYVEQTFFVPSDAKNLSFSYNVVSEEPMEYVGSSFDDKFIAYIISEDGQETIAYETVNNSTWYAIEGINFDGGDDTTYHTKWKTIKYDLSKYRGKVITVRYMVFDVRDSIYDTATLIDNVSVS